MDAYAGQVTTTIQSGVVVVTKLVTTTIAGVVDQAADDAVAEGAIGAFQREGVSGSRSFLLLIVGRRVSTSRM